MNPKPMYLVPKNTNTQLAGFNRKEEEGTPIIELVVAAAESEEEGVPKGSFWKGITRIAVVGMVLATVLVAVQIGLVCFMHARLATQAGDIARASGMEDAGIWTHSLSSWVLAALLSPLLLRTAWAALFPWGRTMRALLMPLILIGLSIIGGIAPRVILFARGMDVNGYPLHVVEVSPTVDWFRPDGSARIGYTREGGKLRFWNWADVITHDTGARTYPVTKEIRAEWEQAMKIEEMQRQADAAIAATKREHEVEVARARADGEAKVRAEMAAKEREEQQNREWLANWEAYKNRHAAEPREGGSSSDGRRTPDSAGGSVSQRQYPATESGVVRREAQPGDMGRMLGSIAAEALIHAAPRITNRGSASYSTGRRIYVAAPRVYQSSSYYVRRSAPPTVYQNRPQPSRPHIQQPTYIVRPSLPPQTVSHAPQTGSRQPRPLPLPPAHPGSPGRHHGRGGR